MRLRRPNLLDTRKLYLILLGGLLLLYALLFPVVARASGRLRKHVAVQEHLAHHDQLTGLANSSLFRRQLEKALERRESFLAVLVVDVDRFKSVNDRLGHRNGDAVLKVVGERLRDSLRLGDAVARIGGDEFGVLLPEAGSHEAELIACRIMDSLAEPLLIEGQTLRPTASVGIALAPDDGTHFDALLHAADLAPGDARLLRLAQAQHLHLLAEGRPLPARALAGSLSAGPAPDSAGARRARRRRPRDVHLRPLARKLDLLLLAGRPESPARQVPVRLGHRRALIRDSARRHRLLALALLRGRVQVRLRHCSGRRRPGLHAEPGRQALHRAASRCSAADHRADRVRVRGCEPLQGRARGEARPRRRRPVDRRRRLRPRPHAQPGGGGETDLRSSGAALGQLPGQRREEAARPEARPVPRPGAGPCRFSLRHPANPMVEPEASKIPLFTVADYTWNDTAYDPARSWAASLAEFAGGDAASTAALRTFAGVNYASVLDERGAPELSGRIEAFWMAWNAGNSSGVAALRSAFTALQAASGVLRARLHDPEFLDEASPWLDAARTWARADLTALDMLVAARAGRQAQVQADTRALVGLVALAKDFTYLEGGQAYPVEVGGGAVDKFVSDALADVSSPTP